jgi:hypothetical protein
MVESKAFLRLLAATPLLLAGCGGGMDPIATATTQAPAHSVMTPSGASPRPATLAVTQLDAPEPLKTKFLALFNADAARKEVALTEGAGARYLARGYISAYPDNGGARLTYVWDIYDSKAHRAQRLNDEIAIKGASPDPWSLVDAASLESLAQRSADEVAAYLSNTPEALAAAQTSTRALSYAPLR